MSRISPVSPPYSPALAQRFARLMPPSMTPPAIFRAVARNEALFNQMVDSGLLGPTGLLDRRTLPPRLRELLILRTCHASRNRYEWQLHVDTLAPRMGLSPEEIEDTRRATPSVPGWSPGERLALRLADSLVATLDVEDGLYAELRAAFDEATLIEMTQLVGLYTMVAMLVALARPEPDRYAAEKVKE